MEFNVEPYYDDFEASNGAKEENYMRILFKGIVKIIFAQRYPLLCRYKTFK